MKSIISGVNRPIITDIKLQKKERDKDDLINIMYRLQKERSIYSIPVISKVQIYKRGKYEYTYSLSDFKKIISDKIVTISSNEILLYVRIFNNSNYEFGEVMNIDSTEYDFSFNKVNKSEPDYYMKLKNKGIKKHRLLLKDDYNNDIQYMKIAIDCPNNDNLIKNSVTNCRKYIDISIDKK